MRTGHTPFHAGTTATAMSDVQTYQEQGFLILSSAVSPELLELMTAETTAICRGRRGDVDGIVPGGEADDDATVLRRHLCIHFPHKVSSVMAGAAVCPASSPS